MRQAFEARLRLILGFIGWKDPFGQPKIHHLDVTVSGEHDIGRLQIAMNNVAAVGGLQGLGDLHACLKSFVQRQRSLLDPIFQGLSLDMFHGDNRLLDQYADNDDSARDMGVEYATAQVRELWDSGVPGVHFYVLNRSYSVSRILDNLRLPGHHRAD